MIIIPERSLRDAGNAFLLCREVKLLADSVSAEQCAVFLRVFETGDCRVDRIGSRRAVTRHYP